MARRSRPVTPRRRRTPAASASPVDCVYPLGLVVIQLLVAGTLLAPSLQAARTERAPEIDGRLDDEVWSAAQPATDFVQKFPDEGAAPTEPTTVRVLYDDAAIYVAIDCQQARAPLVARLTRRDRAVEADRVEVDLATRGDGKSAFHFGVNAAGVLIDGIRYDDTELSLDWDENWEAATQQTPTGWTAELRIPLGILRFPAEPSQSWGFQVRRYISARQEIDEWAFIPRSAAGEVSRYGTLGPLEGLRRGRAFELRPFVLARLRRREPTADILASGTDLTLAAGIDAKWHIARDLTLDATVLPDFAQVEADQVVLNLTTTETFFPEKRPFFLEGLDAFATPVRVLYTRRIGQRPDLPDLATDAALVEAPEPSPIYVAAKLSGQLGARVTVGALAAVTGASDVTVQAADGGRTTLRLAPVESYAALRVKRDLGANGHLGAIATAVTRFQPQDFHDAYVAGLDGRWRSPSGDYLLAGMALASLSENGPPRQQLDGTIIQSGDLAPGLFLHAAKEGGSWLFDLQYEGYGRRFDIDDLGYLPRANLHSVGAAGEYRDRAAGALLLESSYRLETFQRWNTDGLRLAELYQINTWGKLRGFWEYFVELHYRAAHFDDREVGDGTALERDGLVGLELSLNSDPRQRVVGAISTQSQRLFDGWSFSLDSSISLRALPQLDIDLLPTASYTTGEPRYADLTTADGHPLFGRQEAASVGATLRATYTFAPRLTLQAYAQIFLAAVHYDAFSTSSARVVHLDDLVPAPAPGLNPDFEDAVLNVNVVLRWEWRLGSTLYLVYSRSQSPAVGLDPGERAQLDLGAALRGAATDILLLKCSLWTG
jgi:hypothetical protein